MKGIFKIGTVLHISVEKYTKEERKNIKWMDGSEEERIVEKENGAAWKWREEEMNEGIDKIVFCTHQRAQTNSLDSFVN